MRRRPPAMAAALFCLIALVVDGSARTVGATATRSTSPLRTTHTVKKIARGLRLEKIVDKRTPRRIFVLKANLEQAIAFDVALAGPSFPMRETTTRIANRAGAIAAVNGDFGSRSGTVTHPFAEDGELVRTSDQLGTMFAVSANEQHVEVGHAPPSITVTDESTGRAFTVNRWNDGSPAPGEIAGSTAVGGTKYPAPSDACFVHLAPDGPPTAAQGDGIDQRFTVDKAACQSAPMSPGGGGVVLSAPPGTDEAIQLLSVPVGSSMLLHWTFGWPDVFDAIGGVPMLVSDRQIVVDPSCSSSFCRANPRTGLGVTGNGRILLVVVDGRRFRWSVGATMYRFAAVMKDLGAVDAVNLDGGGSSTMVVRGKVVNKPSDGFQRKVSNAAVILPGPEGS